MNDCPNLIFASNSRRSSVLSHKSQIWAIIHRFPEKKWFLTIFSTFFLASEKYHFLSFVHFRYLLGNKTEHEKRENCPEIIRLRNHAKKLFFSSQKTWKGKKLNKGENRKCERIYYEKWKFVKFTFFDEIAKKQRINCFLMRNNWWKNVSWFTGSNQWTKKTDLIRTNF